MCPPIVFGYMLTLLGLFGIPSLLMLAVQNEVIPYQGLVGSSIKSLIDQVSFDILELGMTSPMDCMDATRTSYNITGPFGRVSTTVTGFTNLRLHNADIGVVLARSIGTRSHLRKEHVACH